ncbi:MAG: hypothetical protein J0M10_06525 [Chitinophagales bacterium]|nr:hypothetical protein [Chitinophagales bacterium]
MRIYFRFVPALLFFFFLSRPAQGIAQSFETPVEYLDYIGKANEQLTLKYMVYLSSMSHGKSARKVEKRRLEVLDAINNTRMNIMGMPPYKGDKSFRDTTVAYLKILNSVFNEDFSKIVNMEEIAEQSYDAMEAYMLAQEKANEKLREAGKRQNEMQKVFAEKNNIKLLENTSELEAKMKTASDVMHHYNEVYLVFFKSYKQEAYLMEAVAKKNVNSIEQNINSLQTFAEEGLAKLKDLKPYTGDASLVTACRNMLNFYKEEAKKSATISDFVLKEENFNKIKKKFDSKPASSRTQQDVDEYNKAVNEMNAGVNSYNNTNNDLNRKRAQALDGWNNTVKRYMDTYVPQQKR